LRIDINRRIPCRQGTGEGAEYRSPRRAGPSGDLPGKHRHPNLKAAFAGA
jgi:hypothetical protein